MLVLADYAQIRLMAERLRIEAIDREGSLVVFRFRQDAPLDPVRLMKFLEARPHVRLLPPATLRLDLQAPTAAALRRRRAVARPAAGRTVAGAAGKPGAGGPALVPAPKPVSWWTVRATAGEVRGGFTKEEILRPAAEDPRAPGGLFDRVGSLLADLAGMVGQ